MIFNDLQRLCRLCFKNSGTNDVTKAPIILDAIKHYYGVEVKRTDTITKRLCDDCLEKIQSLCCHKQDVDSGQIRLNQRILLQEQMSHVKHERSPDPDELNNTTLNAEDLSKNESDEDMEDQVTVDAEDFRVDDIPTATTPAAQSFSAKEQSTSAIDRWEVATAQLNNLSKKRHIAGKIKLRRATMAIERVKSPKTTKASKKRRLSVSSDSESHPKADIPVTEVVASKKMRTNTNAVHTVSSKSKSHSESRSTQDVASKPKSHTDPSTSSKSSKSTKNKSSKSGTNQSSILSHLTPVKDHGPKNVHKSSSFVERTKHSTKATAHPPITQFFPQKAHKCDVCSVTLKTQNEITFHAKLHAKGRCFKCKQNLDTKNPDSIREHLISCIYLSNEVSNEYLTHLLKVKVNLNRLTVPKIDEIKRNLVATAPNDAEPKKKTNDARRRDSSADHLANAEHSRKEKVSENRVVVEDAQKSVDKSMDISIEPNKNSDDEKSKKTPKPKKTPKTPKVSDGHDDAKIIGNSSCPVNWIDESPKDGRQFSYRCFESDKPIYIRINPILSMNARYTDDKHMQIIRKIKHMKQSAFDMVQEKNNARKSDQEKRSKQSGAPSEKRPKPAEPLQEKKAIAESGTERAAPKEPRNSLQAPVSEKSVEKSVTPQTTKSPTVTNKSSTQRMRKPLVLPQDLFAPDVIVGPSAPVAPVNPSLPHLLSLPSRNPFRNRAMSVAMSAGEYSPTAARLTAMRRQSVCDSNSNAALTPTTCETVLDHPYANGVVVESQPQRRPPPPFMTKVHDTQMATLQPAVAAPVASPVVAASPRPKTTLKVLSVDDLNSSALNAIKKDECSANPPMKDTRVESPNSTENHTNNPAKRARTKTTPIRPKLNPLDDPKVSINVSLSRLTNNFAELCLFVDGVGRIDYNTLNDKRKQEVQHSLLKGDVWRKMLDCMKTIEPTEEALKLFKIILPEREKHEFFSVLRQHYGNRINVPE